MSKRAGFRILMLLAAVVTTLGAMMLESQPVSTAVILGSGIYLGASLLIGWWLARFPTVLACSDVLLLSTFLYFYGGAANPATLMYLVLVVLASFEGRRLGTSIVALLSIVGFGMLFFAPEVASNHHHHHHGQAQVVLFAGVSPHLLGMWLALAVASILSSVFLGDLFAERVRQERRIDELQDKQRRLALLTSFAASAAHELGTPLASMKLIVDDLALTLTGKGELGTEMADDVAELQAQLQRSKELLSELAARSGDQIGEPLQRISVKELLADIHGAQVTMVADATVLCPAKAFRRVVQSLVKNSQQTGAPAEVLVTVDGRWVTVVVRDQGPGIPAEILARLGEPFVTTKAPGEGVGLGIYLAKCLTEQLGGMFTIQSSLGAGTTIRLQLPREHK